MGDKEGLKKRLSIRLWLMMPHSTKQKIAVALSGGVDSAVAAKILKDQGHEVIGLFLKLWRDFRGEKEEMNRNNLTESLEDSRRVAQKIGIPFYVVDAEREFKKIVVNNFLSEYEKLRTPNPCIRCNEKIKFGLLLKKSLLLGCNKLATGHYAKIVAKSVNGRAEKRSNNQNSLSSTNTNYQLFKGRDTSKDQSYMLYRLSQRELAYLLFPLGDMTKKEVREKARAYNLPVKEKPESQEVCFFSDRDYRQFLLRHLTKSNYQRGEIVGKNGDTVGFHNGLVNYTIGQRKGISQDEKQKTKNDIDPLYVVGFDRKKNRLIVGCDRDVYAKKMTVYDLNWIINSDDLRKINLAKIKVKIRYRHDAVSCKIEEFVSEKTTKEGHDKVKKPLNCRKIKVVFAKSQRAVTSGQSAVFYCDDQVLGGGLIE